MDRSWWRWENSVSASLSSWEQSASMHCTRALGSLNDPRIGASHFKRRTSRGERKKELYIGTRWCGSRDGAVERLGPSHHRHFCCGNSGCCPRARAEEGCLPGGSFWLGYSGVVATGLPSSVPLVERWRLSSTNSVSLGLRTAGPRAARVSWTSRFGWHTDALHERDGLLATRANCCGVPVMNGGAGFA